MTSRYLVPRKFKMTFSWMNSALSIGAMLCLVAAAASSASTDLGIGRNRNIFDFNTTYNLLVYHEHDQTLVFLYNRHNITTKAVRVHVKSDNVSETYPVLFVIKQQLGILSWQLPLQLSSAFKYWTVRRTLCPVRNYQGATSIEEIQHVVVDVSTSSHTSVNVSVRVTFENHFLMTLDTPQMVQVSPSEPQYFEMKFPDDINMLVVSVTSNDDICAIVSIQQIGCPVFDLDKNVQFTGIYQTMTRSAAVTIRKKDFKTGGFYIVFVVKPSNYDCTGFEDIHPASYVPDRTKRLTVNVQMKIAERDYLLATIGAIVVFILFYIFSVTISVFYFIKERRQNGGCDDANIPPMEIERERPLQSLTNGAEASYGTMSPTRQKSATHGTKIHARPVRSVNAGTDSDELDSSVDEDDIDMLQDADSDKNILRTKTFLYVADLARKDCKILSKKSKLYLWNMLTIAVFYALPVIQLVITYESVLHVTGNQDICYYNFLCTYPLGTISDFNHVFSNVGYVMLGFLFIGLVWRRDLIHKQRIEMDDQYEKYYGIPRHFGLFYAMGIALMMEGLLSGCYHVCPNYSNFQFDTSFMYMIAGLCMLKIYQTRHPDINANAYAAFVAFAIIIFVGVIGVLYGIPVFWVGFAVFHILSCLALSAQIYYMGRWKLNLGLFKRIYLAMKTDLMSESHCFRPMYLDRMILLVLLNLVNWTFAVYGLVTRPVNFASYLLAIFIVNLLMYVAFYIIMKLRSREKILPLPLIYIVLSMFTWAAALYFFLQKSTTWELTPAQSRLYNRPCLILNFYDDHDIWHFLSAASMFFSFMILLTLDDDLVYTPRDQIPVF